MGVALVWAGTLATSPAQAQAPPPDAAEGDTTAPPSEAPDAVRDDAAPPIEAPRNDGAAGAAAGAALSRPPSLLHFVSAPYPEAEAVRTEPVEVGLRLVVGEDGTVQSAAVMDSASPAFDRAALTAVRRFRFAPAEVDGKAVSVALNYRYVFAPPPPAPKRAELQGWVLAQDSGQPLSGVRVALPDLGITTESDAAGRFAFVALPPGPVRVQVQPSAGPPLLVEEALRAGVRRMVRYRVAVPTLQAAPAGVDDEARVVAAAVVREVSEVRIARAAARQVPGTQGDAVKVLTTLPGVARSAFDAGQLVVWGAPPEETQTYIDDVPLPTLYHLGGHRSLVQDTLVRDVTLVPGAFGARYGRAMGGVAAIETRALREAGVHGEVGADVLDASAFVEGALRPGLQTAAGVRYSLIDKVLGGIDPDIQEFVALPRYLDAQARVSVGHDKERLSLTFLAADDRANYTLTATDPAQRKSERQRRTVWRGYGRYQRRYADGSRLQVTPFVGQDAARTEAQLAGVPLLLQQDDLHYGLRAQLQQSLHPALLLTLGAEGVGRHSELDRQGSLTLPAREGDVRVFGQVPSDALTSDRWSTDIVDLAAYASLRWRVGDFTLTPSVRLDAYIISASAIQPTDGSLPPVGATDLKPAIAPRAQARWQLHPQLALHAAAGLYHQPPAPADMSSVFGNPQLGLQRSIHSTAGIEAELSRWLGGALSGFAKRYDALVVRTPLRTPPLAEALVQEGVGRSYGMQAQLQPKLGEQWAGWLAYTLSRSERKHVLAPRYRLLDFDQTHVLSAVASYTLQHWTFGTRLRWTRGMPRTPVVNAYYDSRTDSFQPVFGAQNSTRLPDFVQWDLRVERRVPFDALLLRLYLEVLNVTGRRNAEEVGYSFDYSEPRFIRGLPTLAVVGARVEF
ncbi:MAG: TonB-dependent receptor domain-containing protein [Polyangiales bacterium]